MCHALRFNFLNRSNPRREQLVAGPRELLFRWEIEHYPNSESRHEWFGRTEAQFPFDQTCHFCLFEATAAKLHEKNLKRVIATY